MKKRGFTLVELVLVIAMLGVMIGTLTPWMINSVKGYDLVSTRRLLLGQVRSGVDRMVREIRLISGPSKLTTATSSTFKFDDPTGTAITYALSGTNLRRNNNDLMNNVISLAYTYYDEQGGTTTTAANVRSVQIQLTARDINAQTTYTVRTRVFLRNTGNHYASFTSP